MLFNCILYLDVVPNFSIFLGIEEFLIADEVILVIRGF